MSTLHETLGNAEWVIDKFSSLRQIFPIACTAVDTPFLLTVRARLQQLGVRLPQNDDVVQAMLLCHRLGLFRQFREQRLIYAQGLPAHTALTAEAIRQVTSEWRAGQRQRLQRLEQSMPEAQEVLSRFRLPTHS